MNKRTDYTQIIAKTNYAALEKKLERLATQKPPRKRKQVADAVAPVMEKLRVLRAKGWTYEQLAHELNQEGIPVKASALREHLATRSHRGRKSAVSAVTSADA